VKNLFVKKGAFELPSDDIVNEFKDYIKDIEQIDTEDRQTLKEIKEHIKKVAFFDKKDNVWILKD
jgi:hypothetical protein